MEEFNRRENKFEIVGIIISIIIIILAIIGLAT